MGIRLIAGRAGSGKTEWCLARICRELSADLISGPRLILLVPEQAGLQMERGLLARSASRTLGRCEVLSFRRLAARIFNESVGPMPVPLTPIGRQMTLRYLVEKNRRRLREFGRVADRSGFIAQISRGVAELLQETVTAEQLEACALDATDSGDPVAARLHDVALLYRAYLDYLGDRRVDPDGVLDLARSRLNAADWIKGSRIWIDGFAGFTQQQIRMIIALCQTAAHIDIALLMDATRGASATPDGPQEALSLFARTERTWTELVMALREAGVPIEAMVKLPEGKACPRFTASALLARLEQRLFSVPPIAVDEDHRIEGQVKIASRNGAAFCQDGDSPLASKNLSQNFGTGVSPVSHHRPEACATGGLGINSKRLSQPDQPKDEASVRLITARDRREEVSSAIGCMIDLVQRPENPMRYRDIAIVVRDLTPYHDLISASLRSCGIPFFIDRRRPTYHHPLVQLVRACVGLVGGGAFDEAMNHLMKSGLSGLSDPAADAVENYCLAYGLITPEAWDEAWQTPVTSGHERTKREQSPQMHEPTPMIEAARKMIRSRLGDWWPAKSQRSRPKCGRWVQRLYALMERFNVADQLADWSEQAEKRGDLDESSEHQQVWADFIKLLDEIIAALGDVQVSGVRFRQIIESGLSEFTLGLVPATLDQVLVSSIERSRHPAIRALFVLGFSDGQFPTRPGEDSVLADAERTFLHEHQIALGRTGPQKLLDERMLAYVAVTRPSEFLWVSYPQSDEDDQPMAHSPYWQSLLAALPEVRVESVSVDGPVNVVTAGSLAAHIAGHLRDWAHDRISPEDAAEWLALYDWARQSNDTAIRSVVSHALSSLAPLRPAKLSGEACAALWHEPYRTSVTRLETFAQCPFKHYAAYGLRLLERSSSDLTAIAWGRLYHTILEQFVNEMMETGVELRDMSATDIAGRLSNLCEQVLPEYAEEFNLADEHKKAVRWRSRHELSPAVRGQQATIGKTPLRPHFVEKQFGDGEDDDLPALELNTASGKTVLVRGKIDRVDLLQAGDHSLAVVYDYKRSMYSRLKLDEVYHGLSLQLLAYLLVMQEHGKPDRGGKLIPGGAFYLPLLGPYAHVDHPDAAAEEGFLPFNDFKPRGIVDFDWLDRLDPSIVDGRSEIFAVSKKKDGAISRIDSSDAVGSGALPKLLEHVADKMSELAEDWIGGNILVNPVRIGKEMACTYCPYRSVCRFEYATHQQIRRLPRMKRSEVLANLADEKGAADG